MKKGEPGPRPDWPSLRYDYREIYGFNGGMLDGFNNGMFEPGQLLELTAPEAQESGPEQLNIRPKELCTSDDHE